MAEFEMTIRTSPDSERIHFRVFLTYESGYYLDISLYREVTNQATGQTIFQSYAPGKTGPLDGRGLHDPYVTKDHLQYKRFTAQSNNTTYVYDFPEMFRQTLLLLWKQHLDRNRLQESTLPKDIFTRTYRNLNESTASSSPSKAPSNENNNKSSEYLKQCGLVTRTRSPAENDCGIVAWRIQMKTHESLSGRAIIVTANGITHRIDSFGMDEDLLFYHASQLSWLESMPPQVYISANSGARIGLAEELKFLYRIVWNDLKDIDKDVSYLYLISDDYARVSHINCVRRANENDKT